jgi:sugar O-acyltransferase (sialic acid O-acetyltransferase NeuD family)
MVSEPKRQKVAIFGAGGVGREFRHAILELESSGGAVTCVGFLLHPAYRERAMVHDLPVLGGIEWLCGAPDVDVLVAIGATSPRRSVVREITERASSRFFSFKHPRASTGTHVSIGAGSAICAGALASVDIDVGSHVQLHAGCTIGHDTLIEDFVTVAPGANISGRTRIGEGAFIGAGAVILPDVRVGAWSTIGAGAVVTKDVPERVTVVGNPARIMPT